MSDPGHPPATRSARSGLLRDRSSGDVLPVPGAEVRSGGCRLTSRRSGPGPAASGLGEEISSTFAGSTETRLVDVAEGGRSAACVRHRPNQAVVSSSSCLRRAHLQRAIDRSCGASMYEPDRRAVRSRVTRDGSRGVDPAARAAALMGLIDRRSVAAGHRRRPVDELSRHRRGQEVLLATSGDSTGPVQKAWVSERSRSDDLGHVMVGLGGRCPRSSTTA